MTTYRERRLARAERLRQWAESRDGKAQAAYDAAHRTLDNIPMGQPILSDHYSARGHRNALDRADRNMGRFVEHADKADSMRSRADNIEAAAEAAIYRDDPDARERLVEKVARLEAELVRIKWVNAQVRKRGYAAVEPELTAREREEFETLDRIWPWRKVKERGVGVGTAGDNLRRARQRLAELGAVQP